MQLAPMGCEMKSTGTLLGKIFSHITRSTETWSFCFWTVSSRAMTAGNPKAIWLPAGQLGWRGSSHVDAGNAENGKTSSPWWTLWATLEWPYLLSFCSVSLQMFLLFQQCRWSFPLNWSWKHSHLWTHWTPWLGAPIVPHEWGSSTPQAQPRISFYISSYLTFNMLLDWLLLTLSLKPQSFNILLIFQALQHLCF